MVIDEYCYLTKYQAALYEKTLKMLMDDLANKAGIDRRGAVFKLITSLKQICNHTFQYLKYGEMTKDVSGKTEKFISLLLFIIIGILIKNEINDIINIFIK